MVRRLLTRTALALLTLLAACAEEREGPTVAQAGTLLAEPSLDFPDRISELGLFPHVPALASVPVEATVYEPTWPLWSNGLGKLRHVRLPDGTTVDVTTSDAWEFPNDALFFKTFTTTDSTHPEGQRPVETRVIRITEDDVEYASYIWNEDGLDGDRSDLKLPVEIEVTEDGETFLHAVPNKLQCRKCHESHPNEVLGFAASQFSELAGATLADVGLFSSPPSVEPVEHPEAKTLEILGYFQGNCVHCHNGSDGPSSSYDLGASVALEALIEQPTEGSASAPGIRVVPGDPEASILYQAMINNTVEDDDSEGGEEAKAMPPVGVQRKDEEMIEKIRLWILSLDAI
jgi:hypothetical protein